MISFAFSELKNWLLSLQESLGYKIIMHFVYSIVLGVLSAILTCVVSPDAGTGSGIPEVKAILSGVPFPQFLEFKVVIAKLFGCMLAIASGLFVGRVGPVTSICFILCYLMMQHIPVFRNYLETESIKRNILAFATAVAFAGTCYSPIGGVLFSIEVTADVFLTRNYGRSFFASAFSGLIFRFFSYLDYSALGKVSSMPT